MPGHSMLHLLNKYLMSIYQVLGPRDIKEKIKCYHLHKAHVIKCQERKRGEGVGNEGGKEGGPTSTGGVGVREGLSREVTLKWGRE